MMISRGAVRRFLNRDLRDSSKVKGFTRKALLRKVRRLRHYRKFHTKPRTHQLASFLLGIKHPAYLLFLDMGLGKTWVVLNLFRYWKRAKVIKSALVLVPNTTNIQAWRDEVETHTPRTSFSGLDGDKEDKLEALDSGSDVVCMTYASFLNQTCDLKAKGRKKKQLVINKAKMRAFAKRFQGFVLDECTAVKNSQSLTFRAVRQLAKTCPVRYGMTGTPFGKDPTDLWSQFFLIDGGETLGPTLGLFREAMFTEKENYYTGFRDYVFQRSNKKLLHRMTRHNSIRYRIEECEDLPKMTPSTRPVVFPEEVYAYYARVLKEHKEAKGDKEVLSNTFMQMRQLASGFLVLTTSAGERQTVVFDQNPKLDALEQLIAEVPPDRKLLIFHVFKRSGQIISDRLKKLKIPHERLFSGTPSKAKSTIQVRFRRDPKLRVLVCSEAAAYGLNLQTANYEFFYESPTNPITRDQMERRIYRTGQKLKTFVVDIPVKGSVEERILKSVREGTDLRKAIIEGAAGL